MHADPFGSEHGQLSDNDNPMDERGAGATTEQAPVPDGAVVRVSAADLLPPAQRQPPTELTFSELEIPANFREAVENELTSGEKMLWLGRPSRNPQVYPRDLKLPMIGGGLIALAVVILLGTMLSKGAIFFYFFAIVMGVIGGVCLLPLFVDPTKGCRYCYVVTNRRAILIEMSVLQRSPAARSYLPQKLLGLERLDHASVAGAGDLVFEYEFVLPGNTLNSKTGSFIQQNSIGGVSNSPQRVAKGFVQLDQVREVEDIIRTNLLLPLEAALDAPQQATQPPLTRPCACGVTIEAPAALAGRSVKCPRCAAAVALGALAAPAGVPASCREDGNIPADLKTKALSTLDPAETPVWLGQPVPKVILLRGGGYLAGGAVGLLIALGWLGMAMMPAKAAAGRPPAVNQAAPEKPNLVIPLVIFLVSAGVLAVPLVRWQTATRTCYALTNRRALVYKESLFGATRESYMPIEVANMTREDSMLEAGSGDLIFRTVQVISTTRSNTGSSSSVKTIHYGFLAIAQVRSVEKVVRETLIDRFVDKLTEANTV